MTLKEIVEHQANMETLWTLHPTITEAALQAALRHLHAIIENDNDLAEFYKHAYWDIESEM